ncbi:MAG: hypothetical protein RBU30_10435 [Polyangia bacterium]|jgi:tetratricopeptide (TPR) repeat protein|nr:hypothetical protein [Polyangia bacterium]
MTSIEALAQSLQPDPLAELAARLTKKLEGVGDAQSKADLLCRLGLLHWDILGDIETAARHFADAGSAHPEAVRLRLHLAVQSGDQKSLRELGREVGLAMTDREAAARFHSLLAEMWLYHFGDADEAVRAAREALRRSPADASARAILTHALELSANLENLVKHLRTASTADTEAHRRLATLLGDRLGQEDEASKVLRRLRAKAETDPYLLERIWELGESGGELGLPTKDLGAGLLRQKLALLAAPEAEDDRAAVRFCLAQLLLSADAEAEEGEAILGELSGTNGNWGSLVALQLRRSRALRRRDRLGQGEETLALGERCADPGFRDAYLLRAGELFEAAGLPERALFSYQRLLQRSPGHTVALAGIERLLLRSEGANDLIELYEVAARQLPERASALLERAANIAEGRLKDAAEAARLRRPAIERKPDPETLGALARIFRGGKDHRALLRVYQQCQGLLLEAGEPRQAGLYAAAAGVVALHLGEIGLCERHLNEAIELSPNDLFAHTALLGFYRRAGKWRELVQATERELEQSASDDDKARLHAGIARVAVEHLKDRVLAYRHIDLARRLRPDDPSICHLLAQVFDAERNHAEAIAMRRKAVEGFGSSFRAAVLLCEIGDIFARHLGDERQAETAFREALDLDDEMDAAMEALASLYRRQGRFEDLLSMTAQRIEASTDPGAQSRLHLEMAEVAERTLDNAEAALDHYLHAAQLDPSNATALTALERLSRRLDRWDALADALAVRPQDRQTRVMLAEALERLGRWQDLRQILQADLDDASDPEVMASVAGRLADLHEQRLGEPAQALALARRSLDATPGDLSRLERFRRLAEAHGGPAERIDASRRLLELLPSDSTARIALGRRLGELLLSEPDGLDEACRVLEAGARMAPSDGRMLELLARVYEAQGRNQELLEVLQRRALLGGDPGEQAAALQRAAALREEAGDHEVALESLLKAFALDPANREVFTRAERICYRLKRWREVMEVYDGAIDLVESKGSRAYRLADLYARRGQLQLQYLSQPGEAASSYLKVLELDPVNDTALKFLESIFSKEGDWTGLIAVYEKRASLLKDDSKRTETHRRAARVAAAKLKDPEEAARHYEAIHALQPGDAEALDALERYYERTRNWERLVRVLVNRISHVQTVAERLPLHMKAGTVFEEGLRDVVAAVENYKKALDIDPAHREALDALSRIYESTERWAEFIDITRRQVKITGDRSAKALLFFKCGSVMEAKFGKSEDAIRYYEAAIKTSSACLPAVHGLRDLYLRREEWQKVLETLELEVKLWQENKERAGVFARMGRIYEEHLRDLDKAVHYYKAAVSVDVECMPAIRALFDVAFKREDWEEASRLSQNLSQKALREGEPALRSDFYFKRGQVASHAGAVDQAAENFVIALEIRPENLPALDGLIELCRQHPGAYDYESTFRALEKVFQRREWPEAQARVLVARGTMLEQAGAFDAALDAYREATNQAAGDLGVLRPLIALLVKLQRAGDALERLEKYTSSAEPSGAQWADSLLLASEIQSLALMEPRRAEATLRTLLKRQAKNAVALYRHAQELVLLGRTGEAKTTCERLIEVAADPKNTASPLELGRYYYYLGHVSLQEGDEKTAASSFRRALDLAPGYPPASIALARRHTARGAAPQAEALLGSSARLANEQGRPADELRLRRESATQKARAGERDVAIAELRALVASRHCSLEDRFALAELLAEDEASRPQAVAELQNILAQGLSDVEAVRRLVDLCPSKDTAMRARCLRAAELLGLAKPAELQELRSLEPAMPGRTGVLTEDLRARHLASEEVRGPLGQLWQAVHEQLEQLYPAPAAGEGLRALEPGENGLNPGVVAASLGLGSVAFEVQLSPNAPHPAMVIPGEIPRVVLKEQLTSGPSAEAVFLMARAFEAYLSHYSLLLWIGPRERRAIGLILKSLAKPADQREPAVNELVSRLSRPHQKVLERVTAAAGEVIPALDPLAWMREVEGLLSQVALLVCGDLGAAARMIARTTRTEPALRPDGKVILSALPGGLNLLRFYLSSQYDELVAGMDAAAAGGSTGK